MSKRKKYLISYESLDGETQSFAWNHYGEDDIYVANLIIRLNLVNRDDGMIFRVDKYYDEANNKNYQEFTKKEKQKAKEQYQYQ
ncbi:hypothetical protein NFF74_12955 [Proteus mirabilis]|uniref:hypothetical protein n=1 Tax=Proteus mirabilis TaxID=584 RepID=UPI0023F7FFBC|nr:hypothetical protein [Proteus mirabilis]MDF7207087.1 hypothetical protein [Proteus mirabilis]MDF7278420.1 hypothetical protein [Proteus mirabilis]